MNRLTRILLACGLGAIMSLGLSCGVGAQDLPGSTYDNQRNNPIHNANPNSRQGSESAMPPVRGPSTAPNPRPPTLQNGGVGNGRSTPSNPNITAPSLERNNSDRNKTN